LAAAFPASSPKERTLIEKKFYRQLFDMLAESIKGFSLSPKTLDKRIKLINSTVYCDWVAAHKSCLLIGGHYANWEWAALAASSFTNSKVAVLYSPVKNPYIDQYVREKRSKHNTQLVSSIQAANLFKKNKDIPTSYVMIADQSPSNPKRAHWLPFLNQETAVLRGPASFAQQYDLALMFVHISKVKRGFYHAQVIPLNLSPRQTDPKEISRQYMQKLETIIRQKPEYWLWSHKRWKHQAPPS
jgi:KDO2-lipid IV(A) lauroyltransferase